MGVGAADHAQLERVDAEFFLQREARLQGFAGVLVLEHLLRLPRPLRRLRWNLRVARSLSAPEWWMVAEAGGSLTVARLAVWFVPFRRLAAGLGEKMAESPSTVTPAERETAASIGRFVKGLGERLGMRKCLVQALAATWMLQRRSIASTLYFGLAKDADAELKAHAWVRVGTEVLTGARERHDFAVVATFARPQTGLEAHPSPGEDLQSQDVTQ